MPKIPFIGGAYEGISKNANAQTCINLYVENDDTDPEGPMLVGTPGYEQFTIPTGPGGFYEEVDNDLTNVGDLTSPSSGVASINYENHGYIVNQVIVVSGASDAAYNGTKTVSAITDLDNFQYTITGNPATNTNAGVTFGSTTANPYLAEIRGLHRIDNDRILAVVGNRIFTLEKLAAAFTLELRTPGAENPGDSRRLESLRGPVQIDSIGIDADDVLICDAMAASQEGATPTTLRYINSTNLVLRQTTAAADFTQSYTVTEMDGFLIRDDVTSRGTFIYSDLFDAGVESTFSQSSADGTPDDLLAVVAANRQLWLFGEESTEVWYNSGDSADQFQRFQGGFSHIGIDAPLTAKKFAGGVAWLGRNARGGRAVYMAGHNGFRPEIISPPTINHIISNYSYVWNAFAFSMTWEGHEWYVLTFPATSGTTVGWTWVYDATSKNWHQWRSGLSASTDKHIAQCHIYAYDSPPAITGLSTPVVGVFGNRHLMGTNVQDGKLYEFKSTLYQDDGAVIHRERTNQHISRDEDDVSISSLQLDIEEGAATRTFIATHTVDVAGQGQDTSVLIDATTSVTVGDTAEIVLNNGETHLATVTGITAGVGITISNQPLPGATTTDVIDVGNSVNFYTAYVHSMEWSKDGGQTFKARLNRHAGVSGEQDRRLMWYKLGQARNWVFRFKTTVNAKVRIKRLIAKIYGES